MPYPMTRPYPAALNARINDLIPPFCRSVTRVRSRDGTERMTAHPSEIDAVRRAIRIARREAETAHIR